MRAVYATPPSVSATKVTDVLRCQCTTTERTLGTGVIAACVPTGEVFSARENPWERFEPRIREALKSAGIANPDIVILSAGEFVDGEDWVKKDFLVFIEKEKSPAVIADIQLQGLKRLPLKIARRELVIAPGDRFRPSMLEYSLKNLRLLGFFSEVKVESLSYESHGRGIVIVISFKELENRQPVSFSPFGAESKP